MGTAPIIMSVAEGVGFNQALSTVLGYLLNLNANVTAATMLTNYLNSNPSGLFYGLWTALGIANLSSLGSSQAYGEALAYLDRAIADGDLEFANNLSALLGLGGTTLDQFLDSIRNGAQANQPVACPPQ
jgi:hypothetical protein